MTSVQPAPLWRRFAAASYDGLLLLALWMVVTLIDVLVRDQIGLPRNRSAFQLFMFLVGLGFFGWSWTHGGQTLGMRAWRLQLRRHDGAPLRWPSAAIRYAMMLLTWAAALLPAVLQLPGLAAQVHADKAMIASLAFSCFALMLILLDPFRRAPCDLLSRTEVVLNPATRRLG